MNSQQLLFINFAIFVAIVLFFLLGRSKPKQPSRLHVTPPVTKPVPADASHGPEFAREVGTSAPTAAPAKPLPLPSSQALRSSGAPPPAGSGIYFAYNGHEWEAYEVLGLHSGVALNEVTRHYQELIKKSDASTFAFYEAAYLAILKTRSSGRR